MITRIAQLLIAKKPKPPAEWLRKLPDMAQRLELRILQAAASLEEYRDWLTLKRRLQALAIVMGMGPQQQQQAAGPAPASPPAPSLTCPISTGLLVQPMKARPCGHVYSAASARAYFTGPRGKKCAIFGCDKVLKWSDFVKDEALNIRLHKVPEGDDVLQGQDDDEASEGLRRVCDGKVPRAGPPLPPRRQAPPRRPDARGRRHGGRGPNRRL